MECQITYVVGTLVVLASLQRWCWLALVVFVHARGQVRGRQRPQLRRLLCRTVWLSESDAGENGFVPTQTLALLELLHALLGLSKSSVFVTTLQVASRLHMVWILWPRFPPSHASPAFLGCVFAWSIAEVVRSAYYAAGLVANEAVVIPRSVSWLRYSSFLVLYPMGVISELACIAPLLTSTSALRFVYWPIAVAYLPGFPYLYGHMLRLRHRKLH